MYRVASAFSEMKTRQFSSINSLFISILHEINHWLRTMSLNQGSQTQFTSGALEIVFGCGRAATGIPKNRQKVFSSAHINMKWLLMSRNRGVHEISVSWRSSDKVQV